SAMDRSESPALLVIHGIGTQPPGEVLSQCVNGLLSVCSKATLQDSRSSFIRPESIIANKLDAVRIVTPDVTIRLYEVHWADLLPDEAVSGSFSKFDFEETTWFPWLNWRAGLLPRSEYPRWLIWARTLELLLLQIAMSLGLEIVMGSRRLTATALDQTAADVWNYVHSLAGELAPNSPLIGCSERILDRMEAMYERARAEGGPGSPVHVMAHSLGSVIAWHGIVRRLPPNSVERLITIGSPLEKVRFIWASLFPLTFDWTGEWLNFHTPPDPVSGKVKRFDASARVQNFRVWGIGGVGEAHVGYFRNPRVMSHVATGLGLQISLRAVSSTPSWLTRRALDLAVPLAASTVVVLGTMLTVAFFAAVVWLTGFLVGLVLPPRVAQGWRTFWVWSMPALWLVFLTKDGLNRARVRHQRRWCTRAECPLPAQTRTPELTPAQQLPPTDR
ncbi:MAG: uncharacterized protein JWN34_1692, partial [Bryobacterales bacterium]|nr:uncharacterized protein [Bryobacterales bacterium]